MAELDITAAIESYVAAARRQTSDATDIQTAKVTDVTNFNSTGKVTATIHGGTETIQVHCALAEEVAVGDFILVRPGRGLTSEWFAIGFNQSAAGSAIPVIRNASLPDHTHVSGSGQGGVLDTYTRQADDEEITGTWTHRITDAATSAVTRIINWAHQTTGTAAAGFGLGHLFKLENAAGSEVDAAATDVAWEDATSGAEDSAIVDYIRVGGAALAEARRLNETGVVLVDGLDFFANNDEFAIFDRTVNLRASPEQHFNSANTPLSNWAGAPFSTPTIADFTVPSNWRICHYTTDSRVFAYETVNVDSSSNLHLKTRLFAGPYVKVAGLRIDDGTDNNYVELFVRTNGAGTGLCNIVRASNAGGAGRTETTIFSGQLAARYWTLYMATYSDKSYMYYNLNSPNWVYMATQSGRTWTISRAGLCYTVGPAGFPDRAMFVDWYNSTA